MSEKRICFFTVWREDSETVGINMKIRNQVKAFANLGLDAYFCVSASSAVKLYKYNKEKKVFYEIEKENFSNKANHILKKNRLQKKISSYFRLNECILFMNNMQLKYNFNIIYIRRVIPFTIGMVSNIKKWYKNGCKIYWEIPTWGENVKSVSRIILQNHENLMYNYLKNYMRIVAVSSGQEGKDSIIFINNGVDIETIPMNENKEHTGINLICLATFSYWHGYDRLINGMKNYYDSYDSSKDKEINLYMVGNGYYVEELKKQVKQNGVNKYVHFVGVLTGEPLNDFFKNMDVAVGNLGFFRKGVISDTSIKIREYCARGIPFITALKVNDFPSDFPYIFHVPMDESYVDIRSICEFYNSIDKSRMLLEMREFAKDNLTWEKQLSKIF